VYRAQFHGPAAFRGVGATQGRRAPEPGWPPRCEPRWAGQSLEPYWRLAAHQFVDPAMSYSKNWGHDSSQRIAHRVDSDRRAPTAKGRACQVAADGGILRLATRRRNALRQGVFRRVAELSLKVPRACSSVGPWPDPTSRWPRPIQWTCPASITRGEKTPVRVEQELMNPGPGNRGAIHRRRPAFGAMGAALVQARALMKRRRSSALNGFTRTVSIPSSAARERMAGDGAPVMSRSGMLVPSP
jgi:hypothetical protein